MSQATRRAARLLKLTAVAVVVVALTITGYSQATSGQGVASRVRLDDGWAIRAGPPFWARFPAQVRAPKHRCIAKRRVVLYFDREKKLNRVDSDWSNFRGGALLSGRWPDHPRRMIIKLRKKRVVKPGHDYTCSHDRWTHTFIR